MPGHDAAVELQDLGLQGPQLTAESNKAHAGQFRELVVVCIGDDFQQMLDTPAPDRGDDPELDKIGADRVDDGRLLADAHDEASDNSVAQPSWSARTACSVS